MHASHGGMRKRLGQVTIAFNVVKDLGTCRLFNQGKRTLDIAQSLSEKGEFVVETSSRVIERLVCYGQPFDVFGQNSVAVFAEESGVCCVEEGGVGVYYIGRRLALARAWSCADGHGHA